MICYVCEQEILPGEKADYYAGYFHHLSPDDCVKAAIRGERARCAGIAKAHEDHGEFDHPEGGRYGCAEVIERQIRSGE